MWKPERPLGAKSLPSSQPIRKMGPQSTNCKELNFVIKQNEPGGKFSPRTFHKSTAIGHLEIGLGSSRGSRGDMLCPGF